MPLRLLEVLAPTDELHRVCELVAEEEGVLDVRILDASGPSSVARVLLPAENTESVSDLLADELESCEDFRVLLLAVEATIPSPEKEEEEEEEEGEEEEEEDESEEAPSRVSREELYQNLSEGATLSAVYLVTVGLSAVVAAVGLVRGDVAVVIGAMVIAPLLGPNVAVSLAATLGDGPLARRALAASAAGIAVAFGVSFLAGFVVPVDPTVPELAARSRVGFGDLALALAAGSAGALAYTTGLPAAVIGVMVAVALLPPLVAAGLLSGSGRWDLATGAFLLALTNVVCVNLAGVATFLAQKVRPRTWWEAEKAKKATRWAVVTWMTMLAVLVGILWLIRGG